MATISLSFDASLGEIFRTLGAGATLCLARREDLLPGPDLIRLLRDQHITTTTLVTSVLAALPVDEELPELHTLTVGGEALPTDLAAHWGRGRRLLNGYGPTEATIGATLAYDWDPSRTPPLGTPLPNVLAYVLDPEMRLLPVGMPGELYLGGSTLARGYLNNPDLTKERFLPDPFSTEPDARMYRTGDRVRWLSDGQLEFHGRFDEQVKVRGYRIEPGEISAVLRQSPEVHKAEVLALPDSRGDQRLIAYVVSAHNVEGHVKIADELVDDWQQASEGAAEAVEAMDVADPKLNFSGWASSYTDEPIPLDQMQFWADTTVERITDLHPKDVLEIGSGTGLMLFRLAPHCQRYVGVDFAAGLVAHTKRHLHLLEDSDCQVEVHQRRADELDDWSDGSFDCVVVNSVVQYFPDLDYFRRVMKEALRLVRPGGKIFLGDIRNLRLLETFHASVQLSKAATTLSASRLAQQSHRFCTLERELVLDPQLFVDMVDDEARLSHVQVLPKPGAEDNELNKFRYDVVLHVEGQRAPELECDWLTWKWDSPASGLRAVRELLAQEPTQLGVQSIPNARVTADAHLMSSLEGKPKLQTVAEIRQELVHAAQGIKLDALTALGKELGYRIEPSWLNCDKEGRFDVLFYRKSEEVLAKFPTEVSATPRWDDFANSPAQAAQDRGLAVELRDYLGQQLPEYMVPSVFILLDELPLTAQGKLDRQALPVPESTEERPDVGTSYVAPQEEVEKLLVDIWADLLGLERVGIHDNFFELGGHSLLATQVIARVQSGVGVTIPISEFFSTPTVAGLAEWIKANRDNLELDTAPALEAAPMASDGRREAPQSFAQQRLWFISQLAPGSPLYNTMGTMTLRGPLDLVALEHAINELVRRHESLRTTFDNRNGEPIQIVAPPMPVGISVVDLRNLPRREMQTEMRRLRQAENSQPFDLARGPMIRFKLLQMDKLRQILLIPMHHIITDGWSMDVIRREMRALYEAYRTGQSSPLPELTLQYADFATWQREWLQGEVLQKQLDYWKETLGDAEHLELPTDRPHSNAPSFNSGRVPFSIDPEVAEKLYALGQQEGATLFMTVMAAFQLLLGRYSGQNDISVGTPIANRTRPELEGMIGFFVNSLVMRTKLSGKLSFRELLQCVRQTCLDAYAHQDLPFERLVEELAPQRELNVQPLFQVLLVLQNNSHPDETATTQQSNANPAAGGTPDVAGMTFFDLTLFVLESDAGMTGALYFNSDLFDPETAEGMVQHFHTLLRALTDKPDQKLSDISMISEHERQQLLVEWNPNIPASSGRCIHHLVEEQVDRNPEHIAVTFEDRKLSYRELDLRANQVARRLRSMGVCPEMPVGLCLDRGPEAIIGLLGILKAGGVYLPLDPSLPPERLAWFLEDAKPSILLTQKSLLSTLSECQASVLCLDDDAGLENESDTRPEVGVTPENLAYIIYTSGSTGRPKGVMVEHSSITRTINDQMPLFGLSSPTVGC